MPFVVEESGGSWGPLSKVRSLQLSTQALHISTAVACLKASPYWPGAQVVACLTWWHVTLLPSIIIYSSLCYAMPYSLILLLYHAGL